MSDLNFIDLVISRKLRVPLGLWNEKATDEFNESKCRRVRQLDIALMNAGFKMSPELCAYLSGIVSDTSHDEIISSILESVLRTVGGHVEHNVYFIDFPNGIPNTETFWMECLMDHLSNEDINPDILSLYMSGMMPINLVSLRKYGTYQHSYKEMISRRDLNLSEFPSKLKFLDLGSKLEREIGDIYSELASSPTPLNPHDLDLLKTLALHGYEDPHVFPIRENKAIVNSVRILNGRPANVDTMTDILRIAAHLSGGDVTLLEKTKFRSFPRSVRRNLLGLIHDVLSNAQWKTSDAIRHKESWKRLGERLHPHEFKPNEYVGHFFSVMRGETKFVSNSALADYLIRKGDDQSIINAITLLRNTPGLLWRSIDRISRSSESSAVQSCLLEAVGATAGTVSGRVLLGVWEHLMNRGAHHQKRIFVNRSGKHWVTDDTRGQIHMITSLVDVIGDELWKRLRNRGVCRISVNPNLRGITLPLTDKNKSNGSGVFTRGSVTKVDHNFIRFFVYWKEKNTRTDYDLSAMLWDGETLTTHLSWTNLSDVGGAHSGDITSAPNGASEFIDLDLRKIKWDHIIPQVHVFSGESFDEVDESFFGFMAMDNNQKGKPFEPSLVVAKSDLNGQSRVKIPAVFFRNENQWYCKWMDLGLTGRVSMNTVEGNRSSTKMLVRSILDRKYVTLSDISNLLGPNSECVSDGLEIHMSDGTKREININNMYALISMFDPISS